MRIGVLIGRFQVPEPHEGHRFLINEIKSNCDKLVILLGSANRARSIRNPYTYEERKAAVLRLFPDVLVAPLNDYKYSDAQWRADVVYTINTIVAERYNNVEVVLFGHKKDGNDYLDWFPQYNYQNITSDIDVSGTEVRRSIEKLLPTAVQEDIEYFRKEAELFANYPYPETLSFMCGDPVVECDGHILVVQRGGHPGRGSWALPGGFKNRNETMLDAAIRELVEETNLRVPEKVLRGSIVSTRLFDSPTRGSGIPRTTLAVHIRIKRDSDGKLPRVSAGYDAKKAEWVPLYDVLNKLPMHDDHKDIVSILTNTIPLPALVVCGT